MRVLHFYKTAFPDSMGGVEQVINQIAGGALQWGVASEVLSLAVRPQAPSMTLNGYLSHRARQDFQIASTGFSSSAFARFSALAKSADVIHYHFPWPFMDLVHFACRIHKPTLVTYHSDIVRQRLLLQLYRPLQHKFLADMDRIVATSPNYLCSSPVLAHYADNVSVIPIGLDKSGYPQAQAADLEYWRARLGSKFFLFVGVIRYYKGLHILIAAAQHTHYPIVIVGSGPLEAQLKMRVARLGLRNIHFLGFVANSDKVALLDLCHAVVFPSPLRSEAFGIALLEAAMHGKPMISCEIGTGTSYINLAGETGLVVPPNDAPALRCAMQYLWDHPHTAQAMGQRAEQRYWRYFTGERMVAQYVGLYRELLQQRGAVPSS